jgi:hypothetical protein
MRSDEGHTEIVEALERVCLGIKSGKQATLMAADEKLVNEWLDSLPKHEDNIHSMKCENAWTRD